MTGNDGRQDDQKFVLPGEVVGTLEEFSPGEGVYEDKGQIKSSLTGKVIVDPRTRKVSVMASTSTPVVLNEGDVVIGRIYELRNKMAVVSLYYRDGNERPVSGSAEGTLYISKISLDFLDNIRDALMIGDVIRAKVIQAKPSVQLDCVDRDLGVILANCPKCNTAMDDKRTAAECPACGIRVNKKLSSEYRKFKI